MHTFFWNGKEITRSQAMGRLEGAAMRKGYDPAEARAMMQEVAKATDSEQCEEILDAIFELSGCFLEIEID